MKDVIQLAFIVVVIWGCMLAAPVFGFIVGTAAAAWFIVKMCGEDPDGRQDKGSST